MLVLVGSVTAARRFSRAISSVSGIPSQVVHTPAELNSGGCSYSVRVADKLYPIIRKTAEDNNIQIKKIYYEEIAEGKRIYNDLS